MRFSGRSNESTDGRREGIDWTIVTSTLTVGASHQSPDPVLIEVKAVDPAVYPFYGAATLGAAARISGVTPAALVALLQYVKRRPAARAA